MKKRPHLLLIGAGRFGQVHLRILREMHTEGLIELAGIVVHSPKKAAALRKETGLPVFTALNAQLLKNVDAVDIVTPSPTHFALTKKCLKYTNVFVEKPFAGSKAQADELASLAQRCKRTLSVGHVYRYHPITDRLVHLLSGKPMPDKISGSFINPMSADRGWQPTLEFLHFFDLIDFIWGKMPKVVHSRYEGRVAIVDMQYGARTRASFELGWRDDEKRRMLTFVYKDIRINADFDNNIIVTQEKEKEEVLQCPVTIEPLRRELVDFVDALGGVKKGTSAKAATRIIDIAEKAIPVQTKKPSVAVIGGGIFGTSIAAELGTFAQVTLFEKNAELLQEGTLVNQFRHHRGYHYPRSDDTVREIQDTTRDFEEIFSGAIATGGKTYYGLAKEGSLVSAEEFIAFCKRNGLKYKKARVPEGLLAEDAMELVVEVDEPNYHHAKLKKAVEKRLGRLKNVLVLRKTAVVGARLEQDGAKTLSYIEKGRRREKQFDFVINATYADMNQFARWLGHDPRPIRIDSVEVLIVELLMPPISMTIIDGPFATLMPTGNPREFTLYHVTESILGRSVPENGILKKRAVRRSKKDQILKESMKLFPILKDAKVRESRYVYRGVRAYHEHDDSRVTDLIDHGFGMWSILSGKILSSVAMGKRIAEIVRKSVL